ncbi:MAG: cob(I)yrinic acid a,c-diamide adenosyltransferase [Pseudomonadota bacterium]
MGHRLSKIYTRTGDAGDTGLADGSRVPKDSLRIETMGTVDELNCHLGILLTHPLSPELAEYFPIVQNLLFEVGSELAVPGYNAIRAEDVEQMETRLDALNEDLPPLKEFILPGGAPATATCHLARAICRRAERLMVGLNKDDELNPETLRFLNRLSDFLFVAARALVRHEESQEVLWQPRKAEAE